MVFGLNFEVTRAFGGGDDSAVFRILDAPPAPQSNERNWKGIAFFSSRA
jgi:hypothetical protein